VGASALRDANPKDWDVFRCPAADPSENTLTSDGKTVIASSYGMLNAFSGILYSTIANPDRKVIISETAKNGALQTFESPATDGRRQTAYRGWICHRLRQLAGLSQPATKSATRLAFPGSATYGFHDDTDSRHPGVSTSCSRTCTYGR